MINEPTGIIISCIGAVGTLILWVLSTMLEVHVTKSRVMPDGSIEYYGGGDVLGYEFWAFISEYRLMAILLIMLVLLIMGIVLILIRFKTIGREQKYIN